MIIGYLNGAFHKEFLMEDVLMPVIIIIVDEIVFNFVIYVAAFLLRNRTHMFYYMTHIVLPQMLFTALATIIIYRFYVFLNKFLKKRAGENEVV